MFVISRSRLREFWEQAGFEDAQAPLAAWFKVVDGPGTNWRNWGDVRLTYATASIVGNCAVFNIGGNKYRLITRIIYEKRRVYVLKVMTHKEYDQADWAKTCGCHQPPPKKPKRAPRRR